MLLGKTAPTTRLMQGSRKTSSFFFFFKSGYLRSVNKTRDGWVTKEGGCWLDTERLLLGL